MATRRQWIGGIGNEEALERRCWQRGGIGDKKHALATRRRRQQGGIGIEEALATRRPTKMPTRSRQQGGVGEEALVRRV